MSKKVEHIDNQYTSERNRKKPRQQKWMRVVRRRVTVFGGLWLGLIMILSIILVFQKKSNNQATIERKQKEEQFQKKQDEEIALKEELNNLNDKDYIEKVARDDYYLSNNGEISFKLPNDKSSSNSKSSSNN